MPKKIKYGTCEWALPWNGKFGVQFAHELGFEGMQLDLGPWQFNLPLARPEMQRAYLEAGQKYEMEYPSMAVNYLNQTNTPTCQPGLREHYLAMEAMKKAVDTATAMKIPVIFAPSFYDAVIVTEEDFVRTARFYREVCIYAEKKNIIIAQENSLNKEEVERMVDLVNMDNFKIFFDSQNYWKHKGYNVAEVYRGIKEHCVDQIHIKDGKGFVSTALLGEGDSKFFETAEAIKETGFEGWLLMENYYDQLLLADQNPNPYEMLARDLKVAKEIFG